MKDCPRRREIRPPRFATMTEKVKLLVWIFMRQCVCMTLVLLNFKKKLSSLLHFLLMPIILNSCFVDNSYSDLCCFLMNPLPFLKTCFLLGMSFATTLEMGDYLVMF